MDIVMREEPEASQDTVDGSNLPRPVAEPSSDNLDTKTSISPQDTMNKSCSCGTRKIVDVVFSYTNRKSDVTDKYFVRVDVTEEFPFLVSKMSPYYER
jgi:hypothetical protein